MKLLLTHLICYFVAQNAKQKPVPDWCRNGMKHLKLALYNQPNSFGKAYPFLLEVVKETDTFESVEKESFKSSKFADLKSKSKDPLNHKNITMPFKYSSNCQ